MEKSYRQDKAMVSLEFYESAFVSSQRTCFDMDPVAYLKKGPRLIR